MFAIDPLTNPAFYHTYGLYLRGKETVESKRQINKLKSLNLLTLENTSQLHGILRKHADRHRGVLSNPEMYANMINSASIVVTVDKSLPSTVKGQLKIKGLHVTVAKNKSKKLTVKEGEAELAVDFDLDLVKELADITQSMFPNSKGVPIIVFSDDRYKINIPKYMAQIMTYAEIHYVRMLLSRVDIDDYYLRRIFKRINIISNELQLLSLRLSPEIDVIANLTPFHQSYLKVKYKLGNVIFIHLGGMEMVFKSALNGTVKIRMNYPFEQTIIKLGDRYIDHYKLFINHSRPSFDNTNGLSKDSVILSMHREPFFSPRIASMSVLSKFMGNILDKTQQRVLLVVIANKASGKTGLLTDYAEKLSNKFNIPVGNISSDAYGRWRKYAEDRYNIDKDVVIAPTYTLIKELDNDEHESIYEQKAKGIMIKAGISTIDSYIKQSYYKKTEQIKEFTEYFTQHLSPDEEYGETFFHDAIQNSLDSPRVMIFEAHTLTQDAVMGRTNTTVILETINDTLLALCERERTGPAQILLHDAYSLLVSNLHTCIFPWELLLTVE